MVEAANPGDPTEEKSTVEASVPANVEPEGKIREKWAGYLALILIGGFFAIAGIPLFSIFSGTGTSTNSTEMKATTDTAVDWLKGVSAYLAGLVGAVVGYYYRTTVEQNNSGA